MWQGFSEVNFFVEQGMVYSNILKDYSSLTFRGELLLEVLVVRGQEGMIYSCERDRIYIHEGGIT